jgi:hypothetical protein
MEKAAGNDIAPKRPCRNPKPTATLLEHSEGAALPSQQKKINDYRAAEAAKQATRQNIPTAAASSAATTPAPDDIPSPTLSSSHELPESSPGIRSIRRPSSGKRKATLPECEELDDQGDEIGGVSILEVLPSTCKPYLFSHLLYTLLITIYLAKRPRYDPDVVDSEGLLEDVDVQSVRNAGTSREDKSRDIDEFFEAPVERLGKNGVTKKYRKCKTCP